MPVCHDVDCPFYDEGTGTCIISADADGCPSIEDDRNDVVGNERMLYGDD